MPEHPANIVARASAASYPFLQRLRRRLTRDPAPLVVLDANRAGSSPCGKRALLEYLPHAFVLDRDDERLLAHQNLLRARRMAALLGELGYVVDVVDRRNAEFRPRHDYDLVIFERLDWHGVDRLFPPRAVRAFLATSCHHAVHNRNVDRRHELLAARGRAPVARRRIYPEAMPALRRADAIVGVGNGFTLGTWADAFDCPVYGFDNFAFPGTVCPPDGRDFAAARRKFLFFASRSQVQKGLDLLLEVFPRHRELELYVCSDFEREPDFCASYEQELFRTPNVHPIGRIQANGPVFSELVARCAYVIHPSCSEGQSGAVIQCMATGLIPLATRQTGIDLDGFGVELDGSVEEIERVILDVSARPPEWHGRQAALTRRAAAGRYTIDSFSARWRDILSDLARLGRDRAGDR